MVKDLTHRLLVAGLPITLCLSFGPMTSATAASSPARAMAARCAQVRNDDTVRSYDPALKAGFLAAFHRLFPRAMSPPADAELATAFYRCMNGRLLACFVGANLPCAKLDLARDNPGAAEFCRTNPDAEIVPMVATGHDTAYAYRCRGGRAIVTGETYKVDRRGFGTDLWAPMT